MGLDITLSTKAEATYGFEIRENREDISYEDAQKEADKINKENGYIKLYFRKVPRVVPSILEVAAKHYGLDNLEIDSEDDRSYVGEFKVSELKTVRDLAASDKYRGTSGFFFGQDDWTKDDQIIEAFDTFIKQLDEIKYDGLIRYSLSW